MGENFAPKDNIFMEKVNGMLELLDMGIMELWNDGYWLTRIQQVVFFVVSPNIPIFYCSNTPLLDKV